jgi:hypothetical protein
MQLYHNDIEICPSAIAHYFQVNTIINNLKLVILTETGEVWNSDGDGDLSYTIDCLWFTPTLPKTNSKKRAKIERVSYTSGEVILPEIKVSEDYSYIRVTFNEALLPIHSNSNNEIDFTISLQPGDPVKWNIIMANSPLELLYHNESDFATKISGICNGL